MGRSLSDYGALSLWHADPRLTWTPRPRLGTTLDADVAIVGAGFTGLWAAHYLVEADPTLRVVVVEAEVAGYGASGRNGGWCSALFPASLGALAALPGSSKAAALAQHAAMVAGVDEVGRVADRLGVPFAKGGTIVLARTGRAAAASPCGGRRGPRLLGPRRPHAPRRGGDGAHRAGHPGARGGLHTRLRRHPSGAARPPARRRRRAPRRTRLRAVPGDPHRARPRRHRRRHRAGRDDPAGHRGLHAVAGRRAAHRRARLLAGARHRAAARVDVGPDRPGPAGDLLRLPAPDHLRPAHRRRPLRLRRPRRAVPLRARAPSRRTTTSHGSSPACARPWSTSSRPSPTPGSPTPGAGRSASRATGARRSGSTARPGSAGPVGTSATGCRPRTSPAAPCATSCWDTTPTSPGSPGWGTARSGGSRSRCAGSGSTPGSGR